MLGSCSTQSHIHSTHLLFQPTAHPYSLDQLLPSGLGPSSSPGQASVQAAIPVAVLVSNCFILPFFPFIQTGSYYIAQVGFTFTTWP